MNNKRFVDRSSKRGQILLKKKARAEAGGSATRSGLREIALRPGDPAMARAATSKVGLAAGLLGAAAWMLLPAHLVAQSCGAQNGIYTCNYSGTSTAHNLYTGSPDALPMVVNTSGNVVMSVQPGQGTGLNFGAFGENGSGGNVYGLQFNNTGSITLNYGSGWNLSPYGIQASLGGGSGNPGGLSESGSSPSGIHLVNSGAIALNMGGTLSGQGAGIWANEFGGAGENGGTGGWTSGVWVTNFAPITVDISSEGRIGGILAMTTGGDGSSDASTNTNGQGGPVGPASVESYAPVLVNFTWPSDATTNGGQFGILAAIQGGAGGGGNAQANGNWGGYAGATPSITLAAGADVTLNASGTGPSLPTPPVSGGVVALATGGAGGLGGNNVYGYNGGSGGGAFGGVINVTDAKVTTTGGYLPGLLVVAQGGVGGDGGAYNSNHEEAKAGFGGAGGNINAGATVNLNASSAGSAAVSTSGDDSPAIYVTLIGGDGGQGGYLSDGLDEGTAGYGGDGGSASPNDLNGNSIDITVSGGALSTQGDSAPGILAITQGGNGQDGQTGTDFTAVYGGNGGNGGGAGNVQVSVYGGSSITTQGDDAHGIVVQSVGGNAGAGGAGGGAAGHGGVGGTGGDTGSAQVNNGGSISTSGQTARGIIAQSLAGSGGGGGSNWSLFPGYGGKGLAGGAAGSANVSHDGWISTQGSNAQGVLLQSIAGGGGAGGDASGFMSSVGGSGALGGNGNSIYFQSTGGISTTGVSAHGVLGQSVGGGGGDGGGGSNSKVTIGGTGGGGGAGGAVVADLNAGTQITTAGMGATGVLMQAIGGGGGNAGNATSVGLFESISIGGQGGNGGNGGQVQVTATGANILTQGGTSPGIVAQSIGGGGGSGGQAISGSFSVGFSAGFAMGGSGATGGTGGPATVNVIGGSITTGLDPLLQANPSGPGACPSLPCNLLPADSYGVLVQSVGGGGGLGGSALAESAAVGVPVDGGSVSGTLDISLGGTGGSGQDAGPVFFGLSNGGQIFTSGSGSHGVLAQAIGGGGGAGGDSTSMGAAVGYGGGTADDDSVNYGVTLTFSMGGDGGTGGHGGNVLVAMGGTVPGFNNNPDYNSQSSTPDAPGSAPTSIVTYGDYSTAIVAQSVGGGGGNSGMGGGNTQGFGEATSTNIGLNLGSQGGAAGGGGYVAANLYSGSILTWGAGSMGLIAQSIAGGGGTSQGLSVNVAQSGKSGNTTIKPGINFALGGKGVPGQSGGAVDVYVGANIMTKGGDAPGVLAQSIAGGGGVGGSAAADGSNDNPILPQKATDATISALKAREASSNLHSLLNDGTPPTIDLTFGVTTGGTGGTGGDGGAVSIALTSSINTAGDWSKGLVAQSIGGGGGKGGSSAASGTGGLPEITLNLNHAIGGSGGASGNGANVSISLEGTPSIVTAGFGAAGAVGQSIGGGGGIGVDGSDQATGLISVGAGTQTGKSGAGGYGASVMFTTSGSYPSTIATTGGGADGVLLQSIGGGG
ncbi:beta strand repeat-containing protein, partial [Bordetella tumulicola]|uniref:beta strand repeat-containing protein n=1 Tax=Bordetella tumulicola TaxID=1649133 RepID=UPI0039EF3688